MPLSRSSRCLAGRRPATGTTGRIASGGGSVKSNGEAAAARILVATRQPGNPPVFNDAEPWRVALQAGPGTFTPWPCGRTATAGKRGAPKPGSRPLSDTGTPQPPHWTASVKASRALSQHLLRLRPSRASEATDRPFQLSYPTPAPGPRDADPGARSIRASRPREPAARTRLWRDPSPDVRGPVVHQHPAPVEQVGAPVRGLDPVAVDVRKCQLAHLARRVGALRRPVPEA